MATQFINSTVNSHDKSLLKHLRDAGFTVCFQITPYMSDVLKVLVTENVGLIKSIASRHLDKVQMYVWQSISNGYDLAGLTKNLKHGYGVTQRRAARIASNQANECETARAWH